MARRSIASMGLGGSLNDAGLNVYTDAGNSVLPDNPNTIEITNPGSHGRPYIVEGIWLNFASIRAAGATEVADGYMDCGRRSGHTNTRAIPYGWGCKSESNFGSS